MPYIGRGPAFGVRSRFIYTATASQTSFSGNDDAGITLAYTDTLYMDVYQNGVLLVPATDYAASTGTSVVLVQGASADDTVEMLVYDIFSVADSVSAKDGGTFSGTIAAAGYSSSTAGTSNYIAGVNAGNSIQAGGNSNTVVGDESGTAITTGDNNTALGKSSLAATTTGGKNVAVGKSALAGNETGNQNVAVGESAMLVSTTAYDNVAVGFKAGTATTTGHSNTLIGSLAGDAITDANSNVAVGYKALSTNVGGDGLTAIGFEALENFAPSDGLRYTTAVGYQAGKACTSGGDNVFVGGQAGLAVTDGNNNVAIGKLALSTNVRGDRNVAVGYEALKVANPSGDVDTNNTAVGYQAGVAVTTGTRNNGFGYRALASTTTGYYNTAIGHQAGDDITDGFKNICIGHDADISAGGNQHTIVIGESITAASNDFSFGKASNVVTNDFDADANWSRSSDERLKKNITNQTLGLDFINDLRTVKYNWKASNELDSTDSQLAHLYKENADDNEMNTSAVMHNFIAQEVKAALDTAGVSEFGGWKEDQYGVQQVSREMFVIPLVKAVQELSAKNDALESRLAALEAK